jgi:hypothetical protein
MAGGPWCRRWPGRYAIIPPMVDTTEADALDAGLERLIEHILAGSTARPFSVPGDAEPEPSARHELIERVLAGCNRVPVRHTDTSFVESVNPPHGGQ